MRHGAIASAAICATLLSPAAFADAGRVPQSTSYCEARTINYITHSLPQACLTNTWESSGSKTQQIIPSEASSAPTTIPSSGENDARDDQPPTAVAAPANDSENPDAAPTPFMSFEDWKEMMLKRTGQDPQALKIRKPNDPKEERQRYSQDESFGDEDEISLNFNEYSNFEDNKESTRVTGDSNDISDDESTNYEVGKPAIHRNKDAGKTCKERFSYASFDAGATIVKAGGGAKNSKAILVENKDSYMLMECATANKYVIIELTDDVQIDTIVLANFEFFSSMIRHFRVSVSDRYPVKLDKWLELGTFEARNSRDIQPFLVENPQIWAKFVRIEFLTHYGKEYYCPVSLLRIHGSRLLDSWRDSESGADDDLSYEDEAEAESTFEEPEALQDHRNNSTEESESIVYVEAMSPYRPLANPFMYYETICSSTIDTVVQVEATHEVEEIRTEASSEIITSWNDERLPTTAATLNQNRSINSTAAEATTTAEATHVPTAVDTVVNATTEVIEQLIHVTSNLTFATATTSQDNKSVSPSKNTTISNSVQGKNNTNTATYSSKNTTNPSTNSQGSRSSTGSNTGVNKNSTAGTQSKTRGSTASGPTSASPTAQEGVFNAMAKRLQSVESSLSLSLKYIEEQSKHLQGAFQQAERQQSTKVSSFLELLNSTVIAELRAAREQYDEIWQSTVLALDGQRDQSERDILALSSRLNLLADEVVFQKRMAIVQAVLLLSCLCLVIFSRGVPLPYTSPSHDQAFASQFAEILASMQRPENPNSGSPLPRPTPSDMSPDHLQSPPSSIPRHHEEYPNHISAPAPNHAEPDEYAFQCPSPLLTPTRDETVGDEWLDTERISQSRASYSSARKQLPSLPENSPPRTDL